MFRYSLIIILYVSLAFNLQIVHAQDLSANIMSIVDTANQNLNKAEKQIKNGTPQYARHRLKAARRHYANINDSLKTDHPVLIKMKSRIAKIDSLLSVASIEAEAVSKTAETAKRMELAADALRSIKAADRKLIWVKLKGYKGARARKDLESAKSEYENIFKYQKGRYNPDHPQIIELKKRIDEADKAMKAKSAKNEGKIPAQKDSSAHDE